MTVVKSYLVFCLMSLPFLCGHTSWKSRCERYKNQLENFRFHFDFRITSSYSPEHVVKKLSYI